MTLLEEITIRYKHEIYDSHYTFLVYKYAKRKKIFSEAGCQSLAVKHYEHSYCASILKPMLEKHYSTTEINSIIDTAHAEALTNFNTWKKLH